MKTLLATSPSMIKVTFRNRGKAHRGLIYRDARGERLVAACSCPGSQNGRLTRDARIICNGWEKANCQARGTELKL